MCLAIPMKVEEINNDTGVVSINGVKRSIGLHLIENLDIGDYVLVHAGFAIRKIDEAEANETIRAIEELLE